MPFLSRLPYRFVYVVLLLSSTAGALSAQNTAVRPYQVKAAFLFNFTQFVEWPASAYPSADAPIVIGFLGKEERIPPFIEQLIAGERVHGRPLRIRHYKNVSDVKQCHILFINEPRKDKLKRIISALANRSILTVSDEEDFIEAGGMVRFATADNKINLHINADAAKAAQLTISSKLLRLAKLKDPKNRM